MNQNSTLTCLQLEGIGPARKLRFEPGDRLNIITGDNGLGKTFLLECAWFVLSGQWAGFPAYPGDEPDREDAKLTFSISAGSGREITQEMLYDWNIQNWPIPLEGSGYDGLAIYARFDGSFAIWDPVKASIQRPEGVALSLSPLVLSNRHLWNGLGEFIEREGREQKVCNGLLHDWVNWQYRQNQAYDIFTQVISRLSSQSGETLKPGKPVRLPGDSGEIPTLEYPWGDVPIVHAAASVQRIVALAYMMVWAYEEHKIESRRRPPRRNITLLIDEIEAHLHPKWQRSIIPALLTVNACLDQEINIQFIITTHSPMLLASLEPGFDDSHDKLFRLNIHQNEGGSQHAVLDELPFLRHGRADNWFTSEIFGLRHARSLEAERAIEDAKKLQIKENPASGEVKAVHDRLIRYLGDHDTFWPRWTFFAQQHGAEL